MTRWFRLQLTMWGVLGRGLARFGTAFHDAAQQRAAALACPTCAGKGALRDSAGDWWVCPSCHGKRGLQRW